MKIIYSVLALLVIGVFLSSGVNAQTWWNDTYSYRQQVLVENNNDSFTLYSNYTMYIYLNHADLVSNGKAQSDANDVRLVYNHTTELDMINITPLNTANTTLAFMTISDISPDGNSTLYYLYYGNDNTGSQPLRNASHVYDIYADWDSGDLEGWQVTTGIINTSRGFMVNENSPAAQSHALFDYKEHSNTNVTSFDIRYDAMHTNSEFSPNYVCFWCSASDWTSGNFYHFVKTNQSAQNTLYQEENEVNTVILNGEHTIIDSNWTETETWAEIRVTRPYNGSFRMYMNGSYDGQSGEFTGDQLDYTFNYVFFHPQSSYFAIDNVRFTYNYLEPEPSTTLQGEETVTDNPLIECGAQSNITVFNFTFLDEDSSTLLYGDFESEFDVTSNVDYTTVNTTFNKYNQSNIQICMYPEGSDFIVDGTVKYTSTGYSTRYYHFQNIRVNGTTNNINLYLLNSGNSSDITFTVKDNFDNSLSDYIIKATRFYVSEDAYKQVAMGLTDFEGESVIPLKLNEWYIVILETNGSVVKIYPQKFFATGTTDAELRTSFGVDISYLEYYDSVAATCIDNENTQRLTCIFSDTSGRMVTLELTLEQRRLVGGYIDICSNSTTSSSGTVSCGYSGYNNTEIHYKLTGYLSTDAAHIISSGVIETGTQTAFGVVGVLIIIFMSIFGIIMGRFNPLIPIFMSIVVIFIGYMTELILISSTAMGALVLSGALIAYKMRG